MPTQGAVARREHTETEGQQLPERCFLLFYNGGLIGTSDAAGELLVIYTSEESACRAGETVARQYRSVTHQRLASKKAEKEFPRPQTGNGNYGVRPCSAAQVIERYGGDFFRVLLDWRPGEGSHKEINPRAFSIV